MVCGVAAGLAEYFDVNPMVVRAGWIVMACLSFGVAILGYIVLCIVLEDEEAAAAEPLGTGRAASRSERPRARAGLATETLSDEARVLFEVRRELGPEYEDELLDSFVDKVEEALKSRETHTRTRGDRSRNSIVPSALLGIGLATAAVSFGLLPWSAWVAACALLAVGAGAILLTRRAGDEGR